MLRHWEFKRELRDLGKRCDQLKPVTFNRYLREIINKYESLILSGCCKKTSPGGAFETCI